MWRIDHGNLDGANPKLVVLMIGTNNLKDHPKREIVEGIGLIVQRVRSKAPKAKILLRGIFPRDKRTDGVLRQRVGWVNAEIGCWFRPQQDVECTFWIDSLGRYRSDMRHPVQHLLQPGERYVNETAPPAFFFPMEGVALEDYECAMERVRGSALRRAR